MSKMWRATPKYFKVLVSLWMSFAGFSLVTWGACLFSFPFGIVVGGVCAILLEWRVDLELKERS